MRLKLWFARILRLTGWALFLIVVAQWTLLAGLDFAWSGTKPPSFLWTFPLDLGLIALSIVIAIVGDRFSPPDPWLDSWLSPFRLHKAQWKRAEPLEEGQTWATITFVETPGYAPFRLEPGGRCFVEFDDDFMFLGQPEKELVQIEPKRIVRAADKILDLDTGHWSYGEITLTFESEADAQKIKNDVVKLLTGLQSRKILRGHGQIPPTFPEQN